MKLKSFRLASRAVTLTSAFPATIALALVFMPALQAAIFFDNSASTLDFGNVLNWNSDALPSVTGNGNAYIGGNQNVVFSGAMATSQEVQVGTDASPYNVSEAIVPGGKASLTLNSGANLGVTNLVVGQGPGTVDQSGLVDVKTGATLSLSGRMFLGFYDGDETGLTKGTLSVNGGTVNIPTAQSLIVGGRENTQPTDYGRGELLMNSGTMNLGIMIVGIGGGLGQVTQTGGSITTNNYYTMGSIGQGTRHGSGIYDMSGGTFTANADFTVQESGNLTTTVSSFNQSGGIVNLNGNKYIGRTPNGTGVYNLSGSAILNIAATADLEVGGGGVTGAKGILNISGSSALNTNGVYALVVGKTSNSTGTVTQTGGTVTIASASTLGVWLGATAGATASYNLNGGTLIAPLITPAALASVKSFNFDGGQLVSNRTSLLTVATATTFTTTINTGGAKIDTGANGITWNPALLAGTGSGGLTKSGSGTLTLAGANTYTGAVNILAGTLQLGNGTTGTSVATPVTFGGSGRFNYQGVTTGSTQNIGTLTLNAGEGSVQSTYGTSGTTSLTFASLAARTAGATGNLVTSGGTNGTTNLIKFTAAPTASALIDRGLFFNGSSFAAYDAAGSGFVRAYGVGDTNYVAAAGGTSTIVTGATDNVALGGSVITQAAATINTLNLGANSLALDTGVAFQTDGIVQSGGAASTISGGTSLSTATPSGELIIRTNLSSDALTISTPLVDNTGATRLTVSGAGTLTFSTPNTYAGGTVVNSGTLKLGNAAALGASSGAVSIASGAALNLNGQTITNTNALTLNTGSLTNGSATPATFPGLITLGGASSFVAGSGNLVLTNSGTITGSGLGLTLDGAATGSSIASIIGTGTGTVTKNGSGTWTLSGANTYTGVTTINAGTLTASGGSAIADAAPVNLANIAGAVFNLASSETIGSLAGGGTTGGNVTLSSTTLTLGGNNTTTSYAGIISGTGGAISKTGTGSLTLSGVNSYTGGSNLAAGTVILGNAAGLGTSGNITFSGGTLLYGTGVTTDLSARIASGTSASPVAINTNGLTVTFATALNSNQSGGVSVSGVSGLLILTAANTYGGITQINVNTTLQVGASGVIPDSSVVLFNGNIKDAGGKLETLAFTETVAGLSGSVGIIQNKELTGSGTGTLIIDTAGQNYTFNGLIRNKTGVLAITKNGLGTQTILNSTIAANNDFSGGLTINGGTLKLQDAGYGNRVISGLNSNVAVALNATLALENTGAVGNISTTAKIISGAGAVEISAGNVGVITLTGVNTYTGGTTVTAGTLAVNGSSLANAGKLVINGGKVSITSPNNETVNTLYFGGTPQPSGTYGSTSSSATYKNDARFSGTGIVTVTTSPYETWLSLYPSITLSADKLPGADPDGDSLTNLQEYAFGTDPSVSSSGSIAYVNGGAITANGQPTTSINGVDFRAVFGRRKDYVSAGLTYTVQFSADLGTNWVNSTDTPAVLASDAIMDAVSVPYPFFIPVPANGPIPAGFAKPTFFRVSVSN